METKTKRPSAPNPSAKPRSTRIARRDLLKTMGLAPAALLPLSALTASAASVASPTPASSPAPAPRLKVLNPHEFATVTVLSDWILPADERSGSASQANVPAFIDDWLDFKGGREGFLSDEIRGGLTWLDLESNRLHGHDFIACSRMQQQSLLDRIAWPERADPDESHAVAFFSRLRDLVLGGFYSSPEGVKDLPYLGNKMIPVWTGGAPPEVLQKLGVTNEEAEYQKWFRQRQAEGHWVQQWYYQGK